MQDHLEQITKAISISTYSIGGTLVFNDLISILDTHAAAIGVVLAVLTFVANIFFQCLNHKAIKANL